MSKKATAIADIVVEFFERRSLSNWQTVFSTNTSRHMCGRSGFEASHNVNAAVRGLGVWTLLVRAVYQCLGGFAL